MQICMYCTFIYVNTYVMKNWCIQTMVLKMTLESLLDSKEIKPVNPKGNQPWIFIGRTNAEAEALIFWHMMQRANSLERPWWWEGLKAKGEGGSRRWDGLIASLTQWTWIWANSRDSGGQRSLSCCRPWGSKEQDVT